MMEDQSKTATVELLPRGQFIITLISGQRIKGRFSMPALERFCEQKSITGYFHLIEKLSVGMTIGDYADLILVGLEDYHRDDPKLCGYDHKKVIEMMDEEFDGISEEFLRLILHAMDRLGKAKVAETKGTTEEKKSELKEPKENLKSMPLSSDASGQA